MSENILKFNLEEQIVKNLGFEPNPDTYNLVLCGIESVTKVIVEVPTEKKDGTPSTNEYAGKKIPRLEIIFKTYPAKNSNIRERVLRVTEDMPYTMMNDGNAIEMSKITKSVTDKYMRLKHILDTYSTIPNFVPIKSLPDINMEASIDKRIDAFDKFFTIFADAFNSGKNKKAVYRPETGNPYPIWLKVLPDYSTKAWFTIPSFVDTGFIELAKINSVTKQYYTPNIRIKPNESLVLSPKKKGEKGDDSPEVEGDEDIQEVLRRAQNARQ